MDAPQATTADQKPQELNEIEKIFQPLLEKHIAFLSNDTVLYPEKNTEYQDFLRKTLNTATTFLNNAFNIQYWINEDSLNTYSNIISAKNEFITYLSNQKASINGINSIQLKKFLENLFSTNFISLASLEKTYKLENMSKEALAKGLRTAAANGRIADLKSFIFYLDGDTKWINMNKHFEHPLNPENKYPSMLEQLEAMKYHLFKNALHWAADRGHHNCYRILVKNGADEHIKDQIGKTPKEYKHEYDTYIQPLRFFVLSKKLSKNFSFFQQAPNEILKKILIEARPDSYSEEKASNMIENDFKKHGLL